MRQLLAQSGGSYLGLSVRHLMRRRRGVQLVARTVQCLDHPTPMLNRGFARRRKLVEQKNETVVPSASSLESSLLESFGTGAEFGTLPKSVEENSSLGILSLTESAEEDSPGPTKSEPDKPAALSTADLLASLRETLVTGQSQRSKPIFNAEKNAPKTKVKPQLSLSQLFDDEELFGSSDDEVDSDGDEDEDEDVVMEVVNQKLDELYSKSKNVHSMWTKKGKKRKIYRFLKAIANHRVGYRIGKQHYIPHDVWMAGIKRFQLEVMTAPKALFAGAISTVEQDIDSFLKKPSNKLAALFHKKHIIPFIASRTDLEHDDENYKSLVTSTDLTLLHEWYPLARSMKRKIIYHSGPTNSGKTHQALTSLKAAERGIYCGPLRLLALEVYERLNVDGVYCSLVTGQEKRIIETAKHVSCTIEMTDTNKMYDVAVVDEVQMIGDQDRGHNWTKCILGLPATEIHVCGSSEALKLVKNMVQVTGDELQIKRYKRRTKLEPTNSLSGDLSKIERGDCVIAFSRKEIYRLKDMIERATKLKCCVIYGSLPSETRSQQARLFNDPSSDYDVLVASDAVGMGLNLNIRRVVFSTLRKFNGTEMQEITPSQAKQIAGRAGRFGSAYPVGYYTTLHDVDLRALISAYESDPRHLEVAGFFPTVEQLVQFAELLPVKVSLSDLLDRFTTLSRLKQGYFFCKFDEIKMVCGKLEALSLPLATQWIFAMAPVQKDETMLGKLLDFARMHRDGEPIFIQDHVYLPTKAPKTDMGLRSLETKYRLIELYAWLAQRLPESFCDEDGAREMKAKAEKLIDEGLLNSTRISLGRRSRRMGEEENVFILSKPAQSDDEEVAAV